MVTEKRRRELARAKWERQQARRAVTAARARRLRIVGGTALGVVALVLVGLGVRELVGGSTPAQTFPTDNTLTMKTPTIPSSPSTTTSSGSPSAAPTPTTSGSTPATPTPSATTAATGSGTP
ncbi:MAG: hypothetical protein ACR2JU_16885 [Nocardioidaceae bacterium]